MQKLIKRVIIFLCPIFLLVIYVIIADFFKVFGYQDYYKKQWVVLNREMVTTTTYNHFREEEKFNAFIFGSSRSQAFKCNEWKKYLNKTSKPFHFDAWSESIWGISKKIEYIDTLNDTIKHALIILDRSILSKTALNKTHLNIPMPCVSKKSKIQYYTTFLKASLHPKFLLAHTDFSINKKHRKYMGTMIYNTTFRDSVNKKNCDIWYGFDKEIAIDSVTYYKERIGNKVFKTVALEKIKESKVSEAEVNQLQYIKHMFTKHRTNYKIIISPIFDKIPLEEEQINLLNNIFGKSNVYNFSGQNNFTDNIYNYYEASHFRPHVADSILKIIYNKTKSNKI
ncbi:hypothetical protein [Mangrovimonas cancribranchiae]|uniref:Histidine kinase n=1 Tax=Mangrovimonas cancribranchiae TaxID=3080055 RepID=A0AAU6P3H4_9FLAO